ncbi:hypothetical protein N0V85_002490 [Neurospora sp. IMI 360204]|nr:hypothetical protein N0V85_002490 [Neurospora sp. IMI 360204]
MDSVVDTRSHGRPIRPLSGLRPVSRESMSASSTRTRTSNTNSTNVSKPSSTTHANAQDRSRSSRPPNSSKQHKAHFSLDRADILALPPMSEYLQQRIERTRKMEAERASGKQPIERPKTSAGFTSPIASPTKSTTRPLPPTIASEISAKKKEHQAPCMKDAQDLLSKLHKQNFDLKLELFHRREKQTALEELIEKLELEKEQLRSEQRETQDINDVLLEELEKKDKAVEEAVAMIVTLESRIENLLKEREMVRQVEAEGFYSSDHDASHSRNETPDTPRAGEQKVLHRMPSFLTEPTENTETLRNVYLGVRASELGLGRLSEEESPETNRTEFIKVGSPALSLLSESSFLSIYGQNKTSPSPRPQSPPHVDGAEERLTSMSNRNSPMPEDTPTKSPRRPPSPIATSRSSPFHKSQLGLGIDKAADQV